MKVGDYVNYDPTLEANTGDLTYTSTADKTGADSNQEFNVATYKSAGYGWRVLGVKMENKTNIRRIHRTRNIYR